MAESDPKKTSTPNTSDSTVIPAITREKIGGKLKELYDGGNPNEPIDCFFVQAFYSFRKWINEAKEQKDVEKVIEKEIEKFLQKRMKQSASDKTVHVKEEWYRVSDWWPLTYFLITDSEKEDSKFRDESDRDLEIYLNTNIRKELKDILRAADPGFSDVPIIIMRTCKYTPCSTP